MVLLDAWKLLPLFGVVALATLGVSNAFATEIKYDPNEVVLRNNPTVCSITPLDPDLTKNQIEKFADQSRASIQEWEQHLKGKALKGEWPNWEFNYKQLDYDNLDSNAILDCDVVLIFSKTPPSLDFWGILGLAMSDYETGKTVIEIYYLTPQLCDTGEREKDPYENIIWIIQEPCYGDMMISAHLGGVIRHELGHGLGLGHYMSTDETITLSWNKGLSPTPSIMVQVSYENSDELRIAPRDIEKLRGIYGADGFFLNSEEGKDLTLVDPNITEQNYTNFKNSEYGFDLEYPEKWYVDETKIDFEDQSRIIYITQEQGNLNRTITVGVSDKSAITDSNDQTTLDALIDKEKKFCEARSVDDNDFVCKNFVLLESKIQTDSNGKVYTIKYAWNDGSSYHVTQKNHIIVGDKLWEITGEGILASFLLTKDVMEHSIDSFKLDDSVSNVPPITSEPDSQIDPPSMDLDAGPSETTQIPDWVRGNAEWWAQGAIGDSDFVSGIQYLIKEGIMTIPETSQGKTSDDSQEIPSWIKNNADWWAQGLITDDDFVKGIQYLVEQGIISV